MIAIPLCVFGQVGVEITQLPFPFPSPLFFSLRSQSIMPATHDSRLPLKASTSPSPGKRQHGARIRTKASFFKLSQDGTERVLHGMSFFRSKSPIHVSAMREFLERGVAAVVVCITKNVPCEGYLVPLSPPPCVSPFLRGGILTY